MMILLRLWLILSLAAAAPLNPNVDKEAREEDLVTDDIASVDIVNGDGMDSEELDNHTSQNTNRDARHIFYGGTINHSGSIHSSGAHSRINIGSISSNTLPQKHHDEPEPQDGCNGWSCGKQCGTGICDAFGKCDYDTGRAKNSCTKRRIETIPCEFEDHKELEIQATTSGKNSEFNPAYEWDNNIIPYIFTSTSDSDQQLFRNTMEIIEEKTCFKFQQKTKDEQAKTKDENFLEIETASESCTTGCRGYVKNHQSKDLTDRIKLTSYTQVSDKENCKKQCQGFILHELMHALGVAHTFTRSDRDKFITVNEANVNKFGVEDLFKKCEKCVRFEEIPYDCNSIMHYGTHVSGIELMTPKDANTCSLEKEAKLVHGPNGSDLDWKLLNIIGKCSGVYIKELRATIPIMGDELRKLGTLEDANISSDEEELEAKMTKITTYLKDECECAKGKDSDVKPECERKCQAETKQIKILIEELLSTFNKIKKTAKVSLEFLETFGKKTKNLVATAEVILKTWKIRVCLPDHVLKFNCQCKDERRKETLTLCNVGEICNSGICLPVCTSGRINSADCRCRKPGTEKPGQECTINNGCNEAGVCLNACPPGETLLSDCLCENPWKETVQCAKGQVCKHGTCSNGEGDPDICRAVDCSLTDSHKFCPIKCPQDQSEICKLVDCNLPESQDFCPFKCAPVCAANSKVLDADCICKSKNGSEPCRSGKVCVEEGCMEMDPFFFLFLG